MKFGDPNHPFRQTTETARKAGLAAKKKSPWGKGRVFNSRQSAERAKASGFKEQL